MLKRNYKKLNKTYLLKRYNTKQERTSVPGKMTTIEEIKFSRSLHLKKIKAAYKKLWDSIKNQSSRMVYKYFEELKSSYSNFKLIHIQFALKSKLDLSDDSMKEVSTSANEYLELAVKLVDNFMDQQMIKESVNDMELKKVEERKTRSKITAEKK